jgi:cbb3-type cytochrome oxidase subunit 3
MSNGGEFFTRFTIWITLALYSVGVVLWELSRKKKSREQAARLVWTVACMSPFYACRMRLPVLPSVESRFSL